MHDFLDLTYNFMDNKEKESHDRGGEIMKVMLVNGSPKTQGCTYTALMEIEKVLKENQINTELFQIGPVAISGCIGCGKCLKTGECFIDDKVNEFLLKVPEVDGFVFGSPVHFAAASGAITCFMDRAFYGRKKLFSNKLGAAIVSCRRGGATAALDQLNKYFTISNMPIVSSQYWNMVHGNTPDEVRKDAEGLQTMRTLAKNMVWLLQSIEAGKKLGVAEPVLEKGISTNFIRE